MQSTRRPHPPRGWCSRSSSMIHLGAPPGRPHGTAAQLAAAGCRRTAVDRSAAWFRWALRWHLGGVWDPVQRLHLPVCHWAAGILRASGTDLYPVGRPPSWQRALHAARPSAPPQSAPIICRTLVAGLTASRRDEPPQVASGGLRPVKTRNERRRPRYRRGRTGSERHEQIAPRDASQRLAVGSRGSRAAARAYPHRRRGRQADASASGTTGYPRPMTP